MSRAKTHSQARAQSRKDVHAKAQRRTGPLLSDRSLKVFLCTLLTAISIALYSPVIRYSFVALDDHDYVTANSHIRAGLSWRTIKWAFTSSTAANWHPLTWMSHALDYQLFALNPAGHHLDNVLIHALNAVVLFLLLAWVTKRTWPSLLVAALFAVHPLNVESVAWVSERKNVLSTLFFFFAIGAYAWYARKPDWRRYLLVAALFAAGLMSKPMVITLPFVLLLLDYWPLGRTLGSPASAVGAVQLPRERLLLEKVPLLFLSVVSGVITMKVQRSGMAVRGLHQFPLVVRIENAIVAYGLYLWKMLWPAHLALYPHSAIALPLWQWTLSAAVLVGITTLVIRYRSRRYLPVGWFWFLGTLVPVIGLVQVGEASMADRYAYIPLIGIFVMIAWSVSDMAESRKLRPIWLANAAGCVLLALALVTHRQIGYWNSDYDLWAHVLAISENPFAHDAMGSALLDPAFASSAVNENLDSEEQRLDLARGHFERSLEMRRQLAAENSAVYLPDMATTLNNLGNLDRLENRTEDARQHYEQALKIHTQLVEQNLEPFPPDMAQTLSNLALLEKSTLRLAAARQHFESALEIYRKAAERDPDQYLPKVAEMLNNLGFLERAENHMQESRQDYEEALRIRRQLTQQDAEASLPYLATTLNDLGILDATQGRSEEARGHYEEALQSYRQLARHDRVLYLPFVAATLNNLALLDESQNRIEEARVHYKEDLSLFQQLLEGDPQRYARDVARVEASLKGLGKKVPSR